MAFKLHTMRLIRTAIPILFLLFTSLSLSSQSFDRPNGFGGQVLMIDHNSFQEGNDFGLSGLTTGLELSYSRHLNRIISLRVPFKGGLAATGDSEFARNRSFVGADLTVQASYFGNEAKVAPFVYAGFGGTKEEGLDMYTQIPFGGGVNFRIGPWGFFQIKAEYRSDLNNDLPRKNLQYGFGLVAVVGPTATTKELEKMLSDTDGDGIDDDIDRCPDVAGRKQFGGCLDSDNDGVGDSDDSCPDAPGLKALNGCPDADADGVADIVDDCPNIAGTAGGCPDADEDGIADTKDKCPNLAGPVGFLGCPEAPESMKDVAMEEEMNDNTDIESDIIEDEMQEKGVTRISTDSDSDGFTDADDDCPNELGPANGCPDTDGDGVGDRFDACPNASGSLAGCPDSDNDGIADYKDSCPNSKGSASNAGCPDLRPSNVYNNSSSDNTYNNNNTADRIYSSPNIVTEGAMSLMSDATKFVQFKTLSDDLTTSSYNVLEKIVRLMIENPNYRLKVSGHTDDRGEDSVNQRLSEKRARACVRYLRDQGVPELQMSYIGYGARIPVSDNDSDFGRSQNRRVEFELYLVN